MLKKVLGLGLGGVASFVLLIGEASCSDDAKDEVVVVADAGADSSDEADAAVDAADETDATDASAEPSDDAAADAAAE